MQPQAALRSPLQRFGRRSAVLRVRLEGGLCLLGGQRLAAHAHLQHQSHRCRHSSVSLVTAHADTYGQRF